MKQVDHRNVEPVAADASSRNRQRDEAWDALAARRNEQIESGEEQPVPLEEVLARLRAELI